MELSQTQRRYLLDLARRVIRHDLGNAETPLPVSDDPCLNSPAGCFVTLHTLHRHRLRGCIGRLDATDSLHSVVIEMSHAVLDDPRFRETPITLEELPRLELEITILSPLEPAANPSDFDLLQHGIYLRCGGETGCFLPQVARETGWTRQQLLERLCTEKMGLPANAWQHPDARLSRFTATIVGPEPFIPPG